MSRDISILCGWWTSDDITTIVSAPYPYVSRDTGVASETGVVPPSPDVTSSLVPCWITKIEQAISCRPGITRCFPIPLLYPYWQDGRSSPESKSLKHLLVNDTEQSSEILHTGAVQPCISPLSSTHNYQSPHRCSKQCNTIGTPRGTRHAGETSDFETSLLSSLRVHKFQCFTGTQCLPSSTGSRDLDSWAPQEGFSLCQSTVSVPPPDCTRPAYTVSWM
jgi:hypothetical protein